MDRKIRVYNNDGVYVVECRICVTWMVCGRFLNRERAIGCVIHLVNTYGGKIIYIAE